MARNVSKLVRGLCAGVAVLGGALNAVALPVSIDIDFRSAAWAAADNNNSFSVGGVTATALPSSGELRQNSSDGLGISTSPITDDPNEVGPRETLVISFVAAMELEGVWLTKLFDELFDDRGRVELFNGVTSVGVFEFDGTASGELFVDFAGPIAATEARFVASQSGNLLDFVRNRDFSVAGFEVNETQPMPESGVSLGLLGLGLGAVALVRARKP